MKRNLIIITAALLCVLMAVPFAMMTSADVTVPAEPQATGTATVYVAHKEIVEGGSDVTSLTGGDTPDVPFRTAKFAYSEELFSTGKGANGGNIVAVGKYLIDPPQKAPYNNVGTIPATTHPIVITAVDGNTDYTSRDGNGDIYYMNDESKNAGQLGMVMIGLEKTVIFEGDVIFDNIVILNRYSTTHVSANKALSVITAKSKLVVTDTVQFAEMSGGVSYVLNIEAGAYAYLHKLGFEKYTGTGTIVVGDEIKASVSEADFAGFEGKIVDKNGVELFASSNVTTTPDAVTTAPDAVTTAPDAVTTAPDAVTTAPDAVTTAPDATTTAPDATTTAPDATTTAPADTNAPETQAPTKVEVPAKPVAPDNKIYVAFNNNATIDISVSEDGGATAAAPYKAEPTSAWTKLFTEGLGKDGGVVVIVGKAYFGANISIPATTKPIVFTSTDGTANFISKNADGTLNTVNKAGKEGGQYGMFMIIENGRTVTFEGDVIFDNTVILNRLSEKQVSEGKTTSTIVVKKSITITNTVQFAEMTGKQNYNLIIEKDAFAYIDALGFEKYTGTGTIVVGDTIKSSVKASDFAGFEGKIVDSQGNPVFASTTTPSNPSTPTPSDPSSNTGDINLALVCILGVSAVCAGAVLTLKMRRA